MHTSTASPQGTQTHDNVDAHEARSASRRLVVALLDAWDAGDAAAFLACFADDARWDTGPVAGVAVGADALARAFAAVRAEEPWTLHWASNEQVRVVDDGIEGTWLWLAASLVAAGRVSAWSGGDLALRAVATPAGLRIASLALVDRYRTPVTRGWLDVPALAPGAPGIEPDASTEPARPLGLIASPAPGPVAGNEAVRLLALADETSIQRLAAEHLHDVERGAATEALTARWCPDGAYVVIDEDGSRTATGRPEVAALLAEKGVEERAWIRILTTPSVGVVGDRATCSWRDLWTAEVDGVARWQAHQILVDAVRTPDGWRFARVERRRLLDVAHGSRWQAEVIADAPPPPAVAPAAAATGSASREDLDAEVAVRAVMTAYMQACDGHDADAVAELFAIDADWVSLLPDGEVLHGREAVRESYAVACARLSFCVHFLTNERIAVDGDRARAAWSYFEPATNRGELAVWTAGRYDHDLIRVDGVWRFATFRIGSALAAPFADGWVPDHKVPLP